MGILKSGVLILLLIYVYIKQSGIVVSYNIICR